MEAFPCHTDQRLQVYFLLSGQVTAGIVAPSEKTPALPSSRRRAWEGAGQGTRMQGPIPTSWAVSADVPFWSHSLPPYFFSVQSPKSAHTSHALTRRWIQDPRDFLEELSTRSWLQSPKESAPSQMAVFSGERSLWGPGWELAECSGKLASQHHP